MAEEEIVSILNGGEYAAVSLLDLAGLDMAQVEVFRGGESAPEGLAEWKGVSASIGAAEVTDKDKNSPTVGEKIQRAVIDFTAEALAYINVKDRGIDISTLSGITHRERFFIADVAKDIGRVKAFMTDIGMSGEGSLQSLLEQFTGHEFACAIKHRKDPNDTSRVYANFDSKTASPIGVTTANPAAPAGGLGGILKR